MVILFIIYLIGSIVTFIAFLLANLKEYGKIIIKDLAMGMLLSITSSLGLIVILFEYYGDVDVIVYKKKRK